MYATPKVVNNKIQRSSFQDVEKVVFVPMSILLLEKCLMLVFYINHLTDTCLYNMLCTTLRAMITLFSFYFILRSVHGHFMIPVLKRYHSFIQITV